MPLYLVDGHALAYRSYYAFIRRPLTNSKGEETSAVFGFARTLLNLLEKFEPSHVAVVFDRTEVTFREELFPDYKAHRPKMPDPLIEQLPKIFSLVEAMSIPRLSVGGFEADTGESLGGFDDFLSCVATDAGEAGEFFDGCRGNSFDGAEAAFFEFLGDGGSDAIDFFKF